MTTLHKTLLSGAALAAFLPVAALAQQATTDTTGGTVTQVPVETLETQDGTIATTDPTAAAGTTQMAQDGMATQDATGVTNVQTTSTQPMDLSTWTYDDLYANGISVNQVMNANVLGPNGEDVGDVDNVLFNLDGEILSIVARMNDGFLGIGRTHLNIPWDMVSTDAWTAGVAIPFTETEIDAYVSDERGVTATTTAGTQGTDVVVGSEQVAEVDGGVFQNVQTGPNVWLATDLLNTTARLRDGDTFANYGVVNDIVVQDGRIAAVLVQPDAGWGGTAGTVADGTTTGLYGYPYQGASGWTQGAGMGTGTGTAADGTMATGGTAATGVGMGRNFDLPYDATQAQLVQPFDPAMLID